MRLGATTEPAGHVPGEEVAKNHANGMEMGYPAILSGLGICKPAAVSFVALNASK